MKERVEELVGRRARIMWVSTFHSACVRILRKEIDKLGYKSNFSIYDAADSKRLMTLVLQGPRPRPEALPARRRPALGLQPEERAARPRGRREGHPQPVRGDVRRGVHALPAAAARGQRARLRRPDHDHGPPVPGVPGGARDLPAPVPPRARRRVPGHQPRAVRPDPPALRRPDGGAVDDGSAARRGRRAGRARRADGGRRRRPVDLRVPRRQHPQHPRLRAGLPQRHLDPARAELPLHPDHPQRRQRRDRPQQGPQAQAAVVRRRRRRADRRLRRRRRARRGPVRLRGDRPAHRRRAAPGRPTSRSSTAPTPSPGCSRRCSSASAMPYKVVGGVRFYERREVRDALAYLRMLVNPADQVSLRRILNTPKRGIGDRAVACVRRVRRARADHLLGGAAPGRRGARAGDPLAAPDPGLRRRWSRSCSRWSTRGSGPT